jgi:hypothetical protein
LGERYRDRAPAHRNLLKIFKSIVLHVGPHKTGSTYLQYRLHRARPALAAQGWEYPDYGIIQFSQQRLYFWLAGNLANAGGVTTDTFQALLAKHSQLILSSEDFIYLSGESLQKLRSLLDGFQIRVILYVRSPVDLWPSHWQELIRHGWDVTLLEYIAAHAGWTSTFATEIMDPFVQAKKFNSVFGTDAVRIFCYDNILEDGGDIFEHFWTKILRLRAPVPYEKSSVVHPSQPIETIEMLRCLNEHYIERFKTGPGSTITAAYYNKGRTIEAMPQYEDFKKMLERHSSTITLSSNQEIFRIREQRLLRNCRTQIENKAEENKLFKKPLFTRKVPFMDRYWLDRFGLRSFISNACECLLDD